VKIAWLFPGQGAQIVGMGKAVAEHSAAARKVFEDADRALDEPLSKLCFEGPLGALTLTANTQPALLATSTAILAALREAIPELPSPSFAAGHSLGEYSALVAAGALDLEEAIRTVRLRGESMQAAVPEGKGGMAAIIGLSEDEVASVCRDAADGDVLSPANYNANGQIVIAGVEAAIERAMDLAEERGGRGLELKVSAPFHCALMRPAAERMRAPLEALTIGPLSFPVIANVDAKPNLDPTRVPELLLRQIESPVQWVKTVEGLAEEGVTLALEIGPGRVLAGLIKRIDKRIRVLSVTDPDSIEKLRAEL